MNFAGRSLLAFLLLLPSCLYAASLHAPGQDWRTIESAHFRVHFPAPHRAKAQEIAQQAEEIYHQVTTYFDWRPREKTSITLTDGFDYSNGTATPFPYNRIILFLTPPHDINSLESFSDFHRLVLLHEFVHIVHLDKVDGLQLHLRGALGRFVLLFPNIFNPNWLIEGLATHMETSTERREGRGQSAYYRALMRMEVARGMLPLDGVSMTLHDWPTNTAWYLYGVYFFQFMTEQYGEQRVLDYIRYYSSFPIPYFINSASYNATGRSMRHIWREFELDTERKFKQEIELIESAGVTEGTPLTHSGRLSGYARPANDGRVYFIENDLESRPQLRVRERDGSDRTLVKLHSNGRFSFHPSAGLLVPQLEVSQDVHEYYDLHIYQPEQDNWRRLTRQARYPFAVWSEDGGQIMALHVEGGRHSLHRLNREGELLEVVWQGAVGEYLNSIDWSGDGRSILATRKQRDQNWSLALLELETGQWRTLIEDEHTHAHALFSADEASVVFSSDESGVYNIYLLDLSNGEKRSLTNVRGGAFHPSFSADGRTLYYRGLHGNGFDLYRLDVTQTATPPTLPPATVPKKSLPQIPAEKYPVSEENNYQAWRHITPGWWFPFFFVSGNNSIWGLSTSGSDPLYWHNYFLTLSYDITSGLPGGSLSYVYDRWKPSFVLDLIRMHNYYLDNQGETELITSDDTLSLSMVLPFRDKRVSSSLTLASLWQQESSEVTYVPLARRAFTDRLLAGRIALGSTVQPLRALTPIDGFRALVEGDYSDEQSDDYFGYGRRLELAAYSPPLAGHTLHAKAMTALADQGAEKYQLGGLPLDYIPDLLAQRKFPLPGYAEGLPGLRGRHMEYAQANWHLPLTSIQRGFFTPPIGFGRLSLDLNLAAGRAWDENRTSWSRSIWGEMQMETVLGYQWRFKLHLGMAKGLDEFGERQGYVKLRFAF